MAICQIAALCPELYACAHVCRKRHMVQLLCPTTDRNCAETPPCADVCKRSPPHTTAAWAQVKLQWNPISDAGYPKDVRPFYVGLWVWSVTAKIWSWQQDCVWLSDETGKIHDECYQGWDLEDYEWWFPIPLPPPPPKPDKEPT